VTSLVCRGGDILALRLQTVSAPDREVAISPRLKCHFGRSLSETAPLPLAERERRGQGPEPACRRAQRCVSACNFDPLSRGIGVQN
jgi:hypothetical protein